MNDNGQQHPICDKYHVHIYFSAEQKDSAMALRDKIQETLKDKAPYDEWHDKPVGPHPIPQFLHLLYRDDFENVTTWLQENATGFSILVHPNTGDEYWDHTLGAYWIGAKQDLNTAVLQKAPPPPSKGGTQPKQ